MADKIISIKIDVTKIDKKRLFTGKKGTYLDATILWNDEQDQYNNNGPIVQQVTKEERLAGKKGAILGNAKLIAVSDNGNITKPATKVQAFDPMETEADDDLPF